MRKVLSDTNKFKFCRVEEQIPIHLDMKGFVIESQSTFVEKIILFEVLIVAGSFKIFVLEGLFQERGKSSKLSLFYSIIFEVRRIF